MFLVPNTTFFWIVKHLKEHTDSILNKFKEQEAKVEYGKWKQGVQKKIYDSLYQILQSRLVRPARTI